MNIIQTGFVITYSSLFVFLTVIEMKFNLKEMHARELLAARGQHEATRCSGNEGGGWPVDRGERRAAPPSADSQRACASHNVSLGCCWLLPTSAPVTLGGAVSCGSHSGRGGPTRTSWLLLPCFSPRASAGLGPPSRQVRTGVQTCARPCGQLSPAVRPFRVLAEGTLPSRSAHPQPPGRRSWPFSAWPRA